MPSHVTDAIAVGQCWPGRQPESWGLAWILGAAFPSSHSWWSRSCRPIGTTCKILLDYHLQFLKVCGMSCVFYPHKDFTLQLRVEIEVIAHISAGLKIRWPGFKFFFEFASLRVHSSALKSMMVSFLDSSVLMSVFFNKHHIFPSLGSAVQRCVASAAQRWPDTSSSHVLYRIVIVWRITHDL